MNKFLIYLIICIFFNFNIIGKNIRNPFYFGDIHQDFYACKAIGKINNSSKYFAVIEFDEEKFNVIVSNFVKNYQISAIYDDYIILKSDKNEFTITLDYKLKK